MGKKAIVIRKDAPGFMANRLQVATGGKTDPPGRPEWAGWSREVGSHGALILPWRQIPTYGDHYHLRFDCPARRIRRQGETAMPILDLPLAKLTSYRGSSPCPKDIDRYWDAALAEMRSVEPKVRLERSDFQTATAECFDLTFTGVGGARIHAKYLRPKGASSRHPAVLQFHGYTRNAGDWCDKLAYVSQGFSVAAMDCRGQGGSSEDVGGVKGTTFRGHIIRGLTDGAEKLLFRSTFLDTAQLAGIVMEMEEVDQARVAAMGASQGGGLTLACAALEPRIARAAPVFPFLCDYKRVWEMDLLANNSYQEILTFFRQFDPTHAMAEEYWRRLGYIDVQNIAKRIKAEVLLGIGLQDDTCPPSTQFAAYNKIRSPKGMVIYPDFGHEELPGFDDRVFQFLSRL
jgi:cephalosporin-C deacetylase